MKFLLEKLNTSSRNALIALTILMAAVLIALSTFYFDDLRDTGRYVLQKFRADYTQNEIISEQVTYRISSTLSPHFTEATITPLQAKLGDKQGVLVRLEDELLVDRVTATWRTSGESDTIELELVDREQLEEGVRVSYWNGEWESHGFMFGLDLRGYAGESESLVELRF